MTHQDPLTPRPATRTTGTQTTDTQTQIQTEVERKNFALLFGVLIAVLILVPLFIMWLWADDDGAGTVVVPEVAGETSPEVTDEGQDAAIEEAPAAEPAAPGVTEETDDADGAATDSAATDAAPADGSATDTTP